jgi:hypothetical protein
MFNPPFQRASLKIKQDYFALFSILAVLTFIGCSERTPAEQQIRNNAENAADAIRQLDAKALSQYLAPSFKVSKPSKGYSLEHIKKIMMLYRFRKQKVTLTLSNTSVTLDKYNSQLANMETTALITGSKGLLPEEGRIYKVKLNWRQFDDEWKVTEASWQ